jgi:hypothetical protein
MACQGSTDGDMLSQIMAEKIVARTEPRRTWRIHLEHYRSPGRTRWSGRDLLGPRPAAWQGAAFVSTNETASCQIVEHRTPLLNL